MASSLFKGVNIKVQPRSGFDKSRKNILTTKVGTLTPILSDLVIPNSDVSIKMAISASLPPLASETFMRSSLKVEGFFCPLRLLYGGFESWLCGYELYNNSSVAYRAELPRLIATSAQSSYFVPGSLSDFLGITITSAGFTANSSGYHLNIFPFLAYHRIYNDWYRNAKIQKPIFTPPGAMSAASTSSASNLLRILPYTGFETIKELNATHTFEDGVALGALRQRNYGVDYFTSATPQVQYGNPMTVQISPGTSPSPDYFSIAALRAANSIQQWEELQNLTSPRLQDYVKANYGAKLSSGIAQRAVYLGSADYPVYSKGVYANQGVTATNNPFTTVGARYGSAYASGSDFVIKGHFDEPGILMVLVSLVPEVNYSSGISALMMRFTESGSLVDLPNPMLQNVGNEPIMLAELDSDAQLNQDFSSNPFGYVPRYTWHKTSVNEVHGLLKNGSSLQSFVAQRDFSGGSPSLGSSFLQIPTSALDGVTAVTSQLSTYGCWIDSYIEYFVSMPLAQYSIPSLQNPAYEHGVNVHLENNGSKL